VNPWGFVILSLGIILIVIAFHGSQHAVINTLKGVKSAAP
jgi:hypothetical protein